MIVWLGRKAANPNRNGAVGEKESGHGREEACSVMTDGGYGREITKCRCLRNSASKCFYFWSAYT